jgi:hypothetical protein
VPFYSCEFSSILLLPFCVLATCGQVVPRAGYACVRASVHACLLVQRLSSSYSTPQIGERLQGRSSSSYLLALDLGKHFRGSTPQISCKKSCAELRGLHRARDGHMRTTSSTP